MKANKKRTTIYSSDLYQKVEGKDLNSNQILASKFDLTESLDCTIRVFIRFI